MRREVPGPPHSTEDVKIICDFNGGTLNARNSDIHIPYGCPRIVTNNAGNPNGFFKSLPANLLTTMTPEERLGLGNEPLAILKRVAFLPITASLFSSDVQQAKRARVAANAASGFDRLFQGANAMP